MIQLNREQLVQAAAELNDAIKNWKIMEHRGEFIVFRLPAEGSNVASPEGGETMKFWRMNARHAAERFRNVKIVCELSIFKQQQAVAA